MDKKYDLNLGDWGPYNKQYYGVCNVTNRNKGASFNVELFPGFFRRSVLAGNSKSDTGVKLWGANADLTRFCYRYELEWKDRIYCDVDYNITENKQVDITCTFVNNTELNQSLDITLAASLQLPLNMPGSEFEGFYTFYRPVLPDGTVCIDATEYTDIRCGTDIAPDGKYLGEEEHNGASGLGTAIDGYHFCKEGHFLKYDTDIISDKIGIRYHCENDTYLTLSVNGKEYTFTCPKAAKYTYAVINIKPEHIKELTLFAKGEGVSVDCICIGNDADKVRFEAIPHNLTPEKKINEDNITLKYKDCPDTYTVKWYEGVRHHRQCRCADIGKMLQLTVNDHVSRTVRGLGEGVYEVIQSTPVYLTPGETQTRHFRVFKGEEITPVYHETERVSCNSEGKKYAFSQDMMRYNTLLNVVFPIYTRRQYIRHNAPGRFWNSLYSWDSGFIGMGLSCSDFQRGYDCLNTYLTPVGDRHSPYIFHGSVVPTQVFLYKHLVDRFPERSEELKALYPMMKQYFSFYDTLDQGKEQMRSGLTKTWHLSYNSGGWDDYPPQDYLRNDGEREGKYTHLNTTPVITTANTVLISKIMAQIANIFGYTEDIAYYKSVEEKYSAAIPCTWDAEAGYFSYMLHDENGKAKEIMRYCDGTNFNMGMDGVTPYIADICTEAQEKAILNNIKNGLMTDIGVGVVDKRAPYYSPYGYWNGSVWMPHQFILWKALIDRAETDLALEISEKALKVWADEVDASYNCYENFMCHNGRGSGYHHFSGLSCPVSLFFEAYYTPNTITTGWESVISKVDKDNKGNITSFTATALKDDVSLLVCLTEGREYSFPAPAKKLNDGTYSVTLKKGENIITIR